MLKKTKLRLGVVAAIAVVGIVFGVTSPALADPNAGTYKTLNGVGSDTTQDVVGGLAFGSTTIGSYDATGTATIKTTATGPTFNRPNGSTGGVQALSASANNTNVRTYPASGGVSITGQVDFARSSSSPSSSFVGTDLTFIPFARDVLTYAVNSASDFPRDIPLGVASQDSITPAPFTLRNIYRCTVTSFTNSDLEPVTIRPLVPQTTSGTRSAWLTALGISAYGACVTDLGNTVQEHNGSFVTGAGDIVPFSASQFIAQGNYAALPTTVVERRAQVDLGNIGGIKPVILSGTTVEANASFPSTRLVYNVVVTARLAETGIAAAFAGTTSEVCAASATIRAYGFATIGALCGNTTTYKQAFRY